MAPRIKHIALHTEDPVATAEWYKTCFGLDELRRSCPGMPLQSPALGPLVRRVVMIDVAEQEAGSGPMDNQSDVATDPNGPEVLVLRPVDLVQLQARMRRVHLQVERRGLHHLLLVAGQLRETVGEGVGDAELHQARVPVNVRALAKFPGRPHRAVTMVKCRPRKRIFARLSVLRSCRSRLRS